MRTREHNIDVLAVWVLILGFCLGSWALLLLTIAEII